MSCTREHAAIPRNLAGWEGTRLSLQNTSDAVMAQRASPKDALDDFPTPPWASRALAEYVIAPQGTCIEPACGRGHMSAALAEYFDKVQSSDIYDYGFGSVADFLNSTYEANSFDWVITNPPFKLAEKFIARSMKIARLGAAMLTSNRVHRKRWPRISALFKVTPPSRCRAIRRACPYGRRAARPGRHRPRRRYAWLAWEKNRLGSCELVWIPPCRKRLERDKDYDLPPNMR